VALCLSRCRRFSSSPFRPICGRWTLFLRRRGKEELPSWLLPTSTSTASRTSREGSAWPPPWRCSPRRSCDCCRAVKLYCDPRRLYENIFKNRYCMFLSLTRGGIFSSP
jgi:hypothetical protein